MDEIRNDLPDYEADYARSNRAKCKVCKETIQKDQLRIAFNSPSTYYDGKNKDFNHYDCFFKTYNVNCIVEIKNHWWLKYEDQKRIEKSIKKEKSRKRKNADDNNNEQFNFNQLNKTDGDVNDNNDRTENEETKVKKSKVENEGEAALKKQSDLLYGYIEKFKKMPLKDVKGLIEFNGLYCSHDTQKRYELLADCITFGVARCPQCKGTLFFEGGNYVCERMTEWVRCQYKTDQPHREAFNIPNEIAEKYSFLKKYKFMKRDRVYNSKYQQALNAYRINKKKKEQSGVLTEKNTISQSSKFNIKSGRI